MRSAKSSRFGSLALVVALCSLSVACQQEKKSAAQASSEQPASKKQVEPAAKAKTALGMKLAGAAEVSVADLLARPRDFAGKVVRVSGKIEDFCHHKRAWFGISAKSGQGMVRVFTMPRFQTPADCQGKQAVAEGKVELITISAEQAAHFAQDHKFLQGIKVEAGQDIVRPIIRAFGAEFI